MRFYLDTNIIVFMLNNEGQNLTLKVQKILLENYSTLFVSAIAISEVLFLFKIGKKIKWVEEIKNEADILNKLSELDLIIQPFNNYHVKTLADLTIKPEHKDINDHQIISQAITEKIPLISSDEDFVFYENQGLNFIFNDR